MKKSIAGIQSRPYPLRMSNTTDPTTLPTVHLNGTSRSSLAEGWNKAGEAINDFIDAYERIEFNSRDYYVQGPDAWNSALEKKQEMNRKIRELRDYINEHREHLQP